MLRLTATSGITPMPRSAATDSIHSSKLLVSTMVFGPAPTGHDHGPVVPLVTLTTNGQRGTSAQSSSDLFARRELTEHTASRDSLNRCTTRTVPEVSCPRTTATSTFLCRTASSASSVRTSVTVMPGLLETNDSLLGPWVGQ